MPSAPPENAAGLLSLLRDVQGWLAAEEAWALHEAARTVEPVGAEPLVAEIGSYSGRSTIALALGLKARGGGRLITHDPQDESQHQRLQANLREAGVAEFVEAHRIGSWAGANMVTPGSVDLLFVDGDHSFSSVMRDIVVWRDALADGAAVAFNDPYWPGVRRAMLEYVFTLPSPFREPNLIQNTLFVRHRPREWPGPDVIDQFARVRRFLSRAARRHAFDRWDGKRWSPSPWRDTRERLDVRGWRKAFGVSEAG